MSENDKKIKDLQKSQKALELVFECLTNGTFTGAHAPKVALSLQFVAALHENNGKHLETLIVNKATSSPVGAETRQEAPGATNVPEDISSYESSVFALQPKLQRVSSTGQVEEGTYAA